MVGAALPPVAADQDALYYPYIHVRDPVWLKGTLLFFPHVYRMVPADFEVNDREDVRPFAHEIGTRGEPLLGSSNIDVSVFPAQAHLAQRIKQDIAANRDQFIARFSAEAAIAEYKSGTSAFQVHGNKFCDELFSLLKEHQLLWDPKNPNRSTESTEWFGVHPVLGEAIMSTIAVTLAKKDGLHILTSSEQKHRAVATHSTDEIYDALVHEISQTRAPEVLELAPRLAQLVIYSNFDVDQLTPKKIVDLSKETAAFRDLKSELTRECAHIPEMTNENRIDGYLQEAAKRIITQWESHKVTTSRFLKDFFSLGLFDKTESSLKDAAKAGLAGVFGTGATAAVAHAAGGGAAAAGAASLSPIVLGAVPGLAVAVIYYGVSTARKQWIREAESPFRFLSKVEKAGATFVASSAVSGHNGRTI